MVSTVVERESSEFVRTTERATFWPYALAVSVFSPLVLRLAYPKPGISWLALFALIPLFWLWSRSSWKQALLWGWLSGFVFFTAAFHWFMHSIGDFIGSWSIVALVFLSAIEGLSFAAAALVVALACRGAFRTAAIFVAPAVLLIVESIRTRGHLGVPFGELGTVAAHIAWLLPMAAYVGVYGLGFIVALINSALTGLIAGTHAARITGAITLAVLALIIGFGDLAHNRTVFEKPAVKVAIIQGNISQREKWSPAIFEHTMQVYTSYTHEAAAKGAQIVVWPETAVTSYPLESPALLNRLQTLAASTNVWLMVGTIDRTSTAWYYNIMLGLTPQGRVNGLYRKKYLVPFAEYLPSYGILHNFPLMNEVSHFLSGPGPSLLNAAGLQWGTLICYESAFAPYARQTVNAGADALFIITDDAWFGTSSGPYQHLDAALIDAVQTGRWVVRGADTGISQIIDPLGHVITELPLDREGIIMADVGRGIRTPYDRFGNLWLILLSVAILIVGLIHRSPKETGWRSKRGRA